MTHIVCVDAYEGAMEPLSVGDGSLTATGGLGLPWAALAEHLNAAVTLVDWNDWYAYESNPGSLAEWTRFPATRAAGRWAAPLSPRMGSGPIRHTSVGVLDPDHREGIRERGLSARSHGMLAEGDPLFFLSVLVHETLLRLHREEPIDLVVLPMWGGLGYVAQLDRATTDAWASTAFSVVVTAVSDARLRANQESPWTRSAIARRQREELSLALADLALALGPGGVATARQGRLPDTSEPVLAPRAFDPAARVSLQSSLDRPPMTGIPRLVFRGPCDGSSGALGLLHAARQMGASTCIECDGPDMVFAPMAPRSFREYWSGRGWVRELVDAGRWSWGSSPQNRTEWALELRVGAFAHLQDIIAPLMRGDAVVLSEGVADSLGCTDFPDALIVKGEPTAEAVARCLSQLAALSPGELSALRREQCERLLAKPDGPEWNGRLARTTDALQQLVRSRVRAAPLAAVLRRQRDPRLPLSLHPPVAVPALPGPGSDDARLSVIVTCYDMGDLVRQAVESIWKSTRPPDELIVVDDGSRDAGTTVALEGLGVEATKRGLPLRIIRQPNRGLAGARNAGLAAASGTFISFLDGDDLIMPSFYELALSLLQREPGLGAVSAWAEIFGDGAPEGFWNAPQPELPLLLVENQVIVPAVTRTDLLRSVGGYDERQTYNYEDWELSVRYLARAHPIVTIPRYLQRYRVRADSLYRTMNPTQHVLMHERLLQSHRATIEAFAVEVALQVEHRHAERLHGNGASGEPVDGVVPAVVMRARQVVARTIDAVRRVTRS